MKRPAASRARIWVAVALLSGAVGALAASVSLQGLIDAVVRNGPESQLPAHAAVLLGVSTTEQSVPVKQAVKRSGSVVRTFNVPTTGQGDVVMMSYDEGSRFMKAYLVSRAGELRKAVSYRAGAPAEERTLSDARRDFADEIKFWMDFKQKAGIAN